MTTLVTGGSGYIGAMLVRELRRGRAARSACSTRCSTARRTSPPSRSAAGVEVVRGDIRDADARRRALDGADAVVHLAAIVGDPACARDPEGLRRGQRAGDARASSPTPAPPASSGSCSPRRARTTGAWPTRPCRSPRRASCAPVSLYAEQKVGMEQLILGAERRR